MDVVAVVPKHVDRDTFFDKFSQTLRQHSHVSELTVTLAYPVDTH